MKIEFEVKHKDGMWDKLWEIRRKCSLIDDSCLEPVNDNDFFDWSTVQVGDHVCWFQPCDENKNYQGEPYATVHAVVTKREFVFYPREDDRSIGNILRIYMDAYHIE